MGCEDESEQTVDHILKTSLPWGRKTINLCFFFFKLTVATPQTVPRTKICIFKRCEQAVPLTECNGLRKSDSVRHPELFRERVAAERRVGLRWGVHYLSNVLALFCSRLPLPMRTLTVGTPLSCSSA